MQKTQNDENQKNNRITKEKGTINMVSEEMRDHFSLSKMNYGCEFVGVTWSF